MTQKKGAQQPDPGKERHGGGCPAVGNPGLEDGCQRHRENAPRNPLRAVTRPPHVKPFLNLNHELNIQDLIWCLPPFTFSLVCLNTT